MFKVTNRSELVLQHRKILQSWPTSFHQFYFNCCCIWYYILYSQESNKICNNSVPFFK
jgi:hypothetical protein